MGFDGIPRPAQVNPYTDVMNPYLAANAAKVDRAARPLVKRLGYDFRVKALQREQQQYHQPDDDNEQGEVFSEEEAEQILLFAKMRGLMHFALEEGVRYEFHINLETGLVDLMAIDTGQLVLQLRPEELVQLSERIQRYAGMLTDRSG